MQPGDKDGYGRYGYLDTTDGKVLCHECGGLYASVGSHIGPAHGVTADEYRVAHGLPQRIKLIAPSLHDTYSEKAVARIGTDGWNRMVEKRDPTAASHARDNTAFERRGVDEGRQRETARANITGARKPVTRRCRVCDSPIIGRKGLKTCSPLCGRIDTYRARTTAPAEKWARMHEGGESWSAIGRAYGVSHTNVRFTVDRYRKHLADVEYLRVHGPGEVPEKRH